VAEALLEGEAAALTRKAIELALLALLFALLLLWLLVRFLSCCWSPIDAAFCQLASTATVYKNCFTV
jgi:hypothetical protein